MYSNARGSQDGGCTSTPPPSPPSANAHSSFPWTHPRERRRVDAIFIASRRPRILEVWILLPGSKIPDKSSKSQSPCHSSLGLLPYGSCRSKAETQQTVGKRRCPEWGLLILKCCTFCALTLPIHIFSVWLSWWQLRIWSRKGTFHSLTCCTSQAWFSFQNPLPVSHTRIFTLSSLWQLCNVSTWLSWAAVSRTPFLVCLWVGWTVREISPKSWRMEERQQPICSIHTPPPQYSIKHCLGIAMKGVFTCNSSP